MAKTLTSIPARQISLRGALIAVSLAALVCAAWRWGGVPASLGAALAALCGGTLIYHPFAPRRAFALAWSAVYGPSLVMAVYTTSFVACDHCRQAAWTLLPGGPGIVLLEAGRAALDFSLKSDLARIVLGLLVSCGAVAAVVSLYGKHPLLAVIAAVLVAAGSSLAAVMLLAAIRS